MIDLFGAILDLGATIFAAGISVYAYWILKDFKKGMFEQHIRLIIVMAALFALGELLKTLNELGLGPSIFTTLHDALEFLVLAGFFAAVMLLAKKWRTWFERGLGGSRS